MKILLIIDHLDSGGAQRQMSVLATGLASRGHAVTCFVYYPGLDHHRQSLEDAGVTVLAAQKSSRFDPRIPLNLRRIVSQGFDVSLSYLTTPNIYNVLASLGDDVPAIVSERSAFLPSHSGLGTRLRMNCYRLASRIVVNSQHHKDNLGSMYPWMQSKLTTIRNGVDLAKFHPNGSRPESLEGNLNLLAIGSVHTNKNFIGLIEAIRLHRERFGWTPRVRWVGRAGNEPVDILALEQAKQLIERYRLSDDWEWLGVRRDIPALLQGADALIHPSFFEGLPNVICESLASGLPVLAGRVCDHSWLVGEGDRGLLFDPSDPSDIARAMHEFSMTSSEGLSEMRTNARVFAQTELSLERLVTRHETLFRSLVRV